MKLTPPRADLPLSVALLGLTFLGIFAFPEPFSSVFLFPKPPLVTVVLALAIGAASRVRKPEAKWTRSFGRSLHLEK